MVPTNLKGSYREKRTRAFLKLPARGQEAQVATRDITVVYKIKNKYSLVGKEVGKESK